MTQQEEKNISMLAFPDSNSFAQNEGSIIIIWRTFKIYI